MKIVIDSVEYRVFWKHTNNGQGQKSYTQCIITSINNNLETTFATNSAICSEKDNFCRKTGRKVSFSKTIAGLSDKNLRRRFWEAYLHLTQSKENAL